MNVIQFCPDDYPSSGVNTFATELDRALAAAGVASRLVRRVEDLGELKAGETVLHLHGLWLPAFHRAAALARRAGVPVVWSTHGMTAPWSMRHKRWKKRLVWGLYQRTDLRRAAVIHATSEKERDWNRALGLDGVVVPLGTHLPEERTVSSSVDLHLQPTPKTLLFVGRVYPVKAIDRLIAAFAQVAEGWRLRIVGPDQAGHRAELMRLCDELGVRYEGAGRRVEFVGPKYGAELAAEYAGCDGLALVSHTENFGATVVDAMAHGKPVITSTNTPWQEVADGGAGWWVDNDPARLAKAIGELAAMDDARRAEMGTKGRKLVEAKYTWAAVARQMSEVYRRVSTEADNML